MNKMKIAMIALIISAHCATQSIETKTAAILKPAATGLVEGGLAAAVAKRLYKSIPRPTYEKCVDNLGQVNTTINGVLTPILQGKHTSLFQHMNANRLDTCVVVTLGALAIKNMILATYRAYTQPTTSTPE